MASELASKHCVPCRGGVPRIEGEDLARLAGEVPQWKVIESHHLERSFAFPNFKSALAFVDRIGAVAEEEGHHPDICFGWGKAAVTIWTHKIDGLTESDFVLAAKIDQLYLPA